MYSQLDKMDIVIALPDGQRRCIQTDHRDLAEIAQAPELSVLLAMIRVLNPRRAQLPGGVAYVATPPASELLKRAVEAAGGILVTETSQTQAPLPAFDQAVAEAHFDRAAIDLADRVARARGEPVSRALLMKEEAALLANPPARERDESEYWKAVIQLGSLAAAVLRLEVDGAWKMAGMGTLPMVFVTAAGQQANLFGKVIKLIANGDEDSVAYLVTAVADMARRS